MKPNQLRIGNYFHPASNGGNEGEPIIPITNILHQVGSIDKFGKIEVIEPEIEENLIFKYGYYSPVNITGELLLRMGFKTHTIYSINSLYFFQIDSHYGVRKDKTYDKWYFSANWWNLKLEVSYIHEIQNLIFILTGEELKIK